MQAIIHNDKPMNDIPGRVLLITSYLLNAGALLSSISPWIKGTLLVMTVLTTIMAFFNQYKTFKKNFKTLWIVVTVTHVFTFLKPKKNRHKKINLTKNQNEKL